MRRVSIITPIGRERPDLWLETARSVAVAAERLPFGWEFEWCVHLDGVAEEVFTGSDAGRYSKDFTRVSSAQRAGISFARNCALASATGDVIGMVDDDDRLAVDWGSLVRVLDDDSTLGWAAGRARDIDERSDTVGEPMVELPVGRVVAGEMVKEYLAGGWDGWSWPWHGCAAVARRELVDAAGGWAAIPWAEDISMWLAVTSLADGWHVEETVYEWRKHAQRTTNTGARERATPFSGRLTRARAEAIAQMLNR
jgi:glycosyltransferase involved in cell wall biosynthesis